MRVEVHSPEGLEAGYQGQLGSIEKDAWGYYMLMTTDGFGIVLLYAAEVGELVDAFRQDSASASL